MGPIWGRKDPGGSHVGPNELCYLVCFPCTQELQPLLALYSLVGKTSHKISRILEFARWLCDLKCVSVTLLQRRQSWSRIIGQLSSHISWLRYQAGSGHSTCYTLVNGGSSWHNVVWRHTGSLGRPNSCLTWLKLMAGALELIYASNIPVNISLVTIMPIHCYSFVCMYLVCSIVTNYTLLMHWYLQFIPKYLLMFRGVFCAAMASFQSFYIYPSDTSLAFGPLYYILGASGPTLKLPWSTTQTYAYFMR